MTYRIRFYLSLWILVLSSVGGAQTVGVRYDGHRVIRVDLDSQQELTQMLAISSDHWTDSVGVGPVDFRVSPAELQRVDSLGLPYTILIDDVQALIDQQQGTAGSSPAGPSWYDDFKDYDEVNAYLDDLATAYPGLVTTFEVGLSLELRPIRGLRISSDATDKPAFVIQGCQHAREWITVMVTTDIAEFLLTNSTDPLIASLLDRIAFYIVPILNPDGYVHSWGPDRLWRKNRRDNGDGTFGVDLNRNWSYEWGGPGSSGDTDSATYRGTAAFSEPESTAMRDFVLGLSEVRFFLDVHSYGQLFLQPWGYTDTPPPDHASFEALGQTLVEVIADASGTAYTHGSGGDILYVASGVAPDWSYGELGVPAFTIELRDTGAFGFLLPADQIVPTVEETEPAIVAIAQWILDPFEISFPAGLPETLAPAQPTTVQVQIVERYSAILDLAASSLLTSVNGAAFEASPLVPIGPALYEMTLPAVACGSQISFYLELTSSAGEVMVTPVEAPSGLFGAMAVEVTPMFLDDFELDTGWTVSGDASTGQWERGAPIGGGDRGDPPVDGDGSGWCFLTENVDGDFDIDDGSTIVTSPPLDGASASGEVFVEYQRWYSNSSGAGPAEDLFLVEISDDDGQTWVELETVGPDGPEVNGGWITVSHRVADYVSLTNEIRVRFTASDLGSPSIVEAGVDAFVLEARGCLGSSFTRADCNDDTAFDVSDPVFALAYFFSGGVTPHCESACDSNDDGAINIADAVHSLITLFESGAPPTAPFPGCGTDPTADGLTCEQFDACVP